jgi:hypothetical protein
VRPPNFYVVETIAGDKKSSEKFDDSKHDETKH